MSEFTEQSLPRRQFLRGSFLHSLKTEQVIQQGQNTIRPPWADLAYFLQNCTACSACISACEMQIIKQGAGGYPEIDFSLGQQTCSFCQACVKSCPEPVFRSISESPWQHKVEIQQGCLVQMNVECRRCEESCEQRAFTFRRQLGGKYSLQLHSTLCNGCGACLNVCPTQVIHILSL